MRPPRRTAAVFLDRDGTIIVDASYLRDPDDVVLLPGAAAAIARLNSASIPVFVMTNQSGIARGLLTEDDYSATERRLTELLKARGARITATYHCPHHPEFGIACDCRKPASGMFRQAIREHGLSKPAAFVGDRWRDVAAAPELEGFAYLIDGPSTPDEDVIQADAAGVAVVTSLADAVDRILEGART